MPLLVELLAPSRGNPSRATHHLFASLQKGGRPLANSLPGAARPACYSAAQQYSHQLMCWAPLHCVCGTYISGISPMYSVLCIFVRVVAAVCASVQLFVWSRGSLLVEETWPTGRARSFCKMLAKQDPALSIQCSLPRNLLLSLLIMVSVFFRLFFNS